jgi:hypothetical protein
MDHSQQEIYNRKFLDFATGFGLLRNFTPRYIPKTRLGDLGGLSHG